MSLIKNFQHFPAVKTRDTKRQHSFVKPRWSDDMLSLLIIRWFYLKSLHSGNFDLLCPFRVCTPPAILPYRDIWYFSRWYVWDHFVSVFLVWIFLFSVLWKILTDSQYIWVFRFPYLMLCIWVCRRLQIAEMFLEFAVSWQFPDFRSVYFEQFFSFR